VKHRTTFENLDSTGDKKVGQMVSTSQPRHQCLQNILLHLHHARTMRKSQVI